MVSMNDVAAATLLVEHGVVELDMMRKALRAHHQGSAGMSLLDLLKARSVITEEQFHQAQRTVRRHGFLKVEAVYLAMLRDRKVVSEEWINRAQTKQREEGYRRRVGELLAAAGQLTAEQDQYLQQGAQGALRERADQLIVAMAKGAFQSFGSEVKSSPKPDVRRRMTASGASLSGAVSKKELEKLLETGRRVSGPAPVPPPSAPPPPLEPPPPMSGSGIKAAKPVAAPQTEAKPSAETRPVEEKALKGPKKKPELPDVGEKIGVYEIVKKLGEGGMGVVYAVKAPDREEALALKVMRTAGGDALARFKREILATSFISHPNVIEIYDAGEDGGLQFMAMELVKGEELRDVIKREGKLELPRALAVTRQILSALAATHRAKVIHRDVKPENFMVLERDGKDFLKMMDFGIARIIDQPEEISEKIFRTMQGKFSGSARYTSPESITEDEIDGRADLYMVGLILFELLTGRLPFDGEKAMDFIKAQLHKKPLSLASQDPALAEPKSLQRFVSRLLEKDREKRFQKAEEALAFLTEIVLEDLEGGGGAPEAAAKPGCLGALLGVFSGKKKSAPASG